MCDFPASNNSIVFAGQDNPSDLCIVGDVPSILDASDTAHEGPYDGIEMGC
jgi:uracil-DNA glycosylase